MKEARKQATEGRSDCKRVLKWLKGWDLSPDNQLVVRNQLVGMTPNLQIDDDQKLFNTIDSILQKVDAMDADQLGRGIHSTCPGGQLSIILINI